MDAFRTLLETSSHSISVEVGLDGGIRAVNPGFVHQVGTPPDALIGRDLSAFLTARDQVRLRAWMDGEALPEGPTWIDFASRDGAPFTLRCVIDRSGEALRIVGEPEVEEERSASEAMMRLNNDLATLARERGRREREVRRLRSELEAALEDLRQSYWHLQKFQECLLICMECGKVKSDLVRWQSIVDYLKDNEILLSHGYCPECGEAKLAEWELE